MSVDTADFGAILGAPFLLHINCRLIPKELRLRWGLAALNVVFVAACTTPFVAALGGALGAWRSKGGRGL